MPGLSLREAAKEAGTSKSTILRAIQAGRLSARRTEEGGYAIDPAELFRVYPPKRAGESAPQSPAEAPERRAAGETVELQIRNAQLEAVVNALRAILETEKQRAEEIREDRDRWAAQAGRLALPAPAQPRRSLFAFRRRPSAA